MAKELLLSGEVLTCTYPAGTTFASLCLHFTFSSNWWWPPFTSACWFTFSEKFLKVHQVLKIPKSLHFVFTDTFLTAVLTKIVWNIYLKTQERDRN